MKTNGYFRSKRRKHKLEKIKKQHSYFVQRKHWDTPNTFLYRFYLSGIRTESKQQTNRIVRHSVNVPNYTGYRRIFDYWRELY